MAEPEASAKENNAEEVPEGAAVVPVIPESAGVNPLFLAVFHALVFLEGSSEDLIDPSAADEAAQYLATYLQRLSGDDLQNLRKDLNRLLEHARRNKWSNDQLDFIQNFTHQFGIGEIKS
jgi:hypothetical protein